MTLKGRGFLVETALIPSNRAGVLDFDRLCIELAFSAN